MPPDSDRHEPLPPRRACEYSPRLQLRAAVAPPSRSLRRAPLNESLEWERLHGDYRFINRVLVRDERRIPTGRVRGQNPRERYLACCRVVLLRDRLDAVDKREVLREVLL